MGSETKDEKNVTEQLGTSEKKMNDTTGRCRDMEDADKWSVRVHDGKGEDLA